MHHNLTSTNNQFSFKQKKLTIYLTIFKINKKGLKLSLTVLTKKTKTK